MERIKLYIVGAGSVGCHVAFNYESYNLNYEIAGFLDDDEGKIGAVYGGIKVIDNVDYLLSLNKKTAVIVGIAFPHMKRKIIEKLSENRNLIFPSLVSDKAWISKGCTVGKGSIIYPGCSINYESEIGDFAVMNLNCALGHHASVGNYSSLAPGVNFGGHTTVGKFVDIGIGVSTIQDVYVGDNCIIGGQSMLIENVPENSVVVGVPGRVVKTLC